MFLSLNLDFDLVIYIDEIFILCDLNLTFLSLNLDFDLVIYIDEVFIIVI